MTMRAVTGSFQTDDDFYREVKHFLHQFDEIKDTGIGYMVLETERQCDSV